MAALRDPGSVGRTGLAGLVAVVVLALSTSASNTMEGLGEDVQAAGDAVTGTAEDVQDDTE